MNADVTFPPCPPGAPGLPDTCVRVNTFRNQRAGGNPLPTFFAGIVGVPNQGVRATATAQVVTGDTTECLRPWAVVDKWAESAQVPADGVGPDPGPISTYGRYPQNPNGGGPQSVPVEPTDLYVRPGQPGATGFTLPADIGRRFAVKVGASGGNEVSPGVV